MVRRPELQACGRGEGGRARGNTAARRLRRSDLPAPRGGGGGERRLKEGGHGQPCQSIPSTPTDSARPQRPCNRVAPAQLASLPPAKPPVTVVVKEGGGEGSRGEICGLEVVGAPRPDCGGGGGGVNLGPHQCGMTRSFPPGGHPPPPPPPPPQANAPSALTTSH